MQCIGAIVPQWCVIGIRDGIQGERPELCLYSEFTQVSLATCLIFMYKRICVLYGIRVRARTVPHHQRIKHPLSFFK